MVRNPAHKGYYVVITREGDNPAHFCWKILRHRTPMGVKLFECGFHSYQAAQLAGKEALIELLDQIHKEEVKRR
jgi:hypothetical protein